MVERSRSQATYVSRIRDFIGMTMVLEYAVLIPLLGSGGWDFLGAYRPDTLEGMYGRNTWNPYPAYWLITPFALLPPGLGYLLWNLTAAGAFILLVRYWKGGLFAFGLSLPCFWIFYGGQFEGFVALGLFLAMRPHVVLAGVGLTLLSFKPQVGLFPILFVLQQRREWKIIIVPALVYGLSLFSWGWWIPDWLNSLSGVGRYSTTNTSLFPYSLLLLPVLWRYRASLKTWLTVQALVSPYFAAYSLVILFCQTSPIWANIFLWALYLSASVIDYPMFPAFLVPMGMLISAIVEAHRRPSRLPGQAPNTM